MRAANSDFASLSGLNTVYNHCLPPASAGNGQLRIMVYTRKIPVVNVVGYCCF